MQRATTHLQLTITDDGEIHYVVPAHWGLDELEKFEPVLEQIRRWQHRLHVIPTPRPEPTCATVDA